MTCYIAKIRIIDMSAIQYIVGQLTYYDVTVSASKLFDINTKYCKDEENNNNESFDILRIKRIVIEYNDVQFFSFLMYIKPEIFTYTDLIKVIQNSINCEETWMESKMIDIVFSSKKFNVNMINSDGRSVLWHFYKNKEVLGSLIEKGIDGNIRDNHGMTVFDYINIKKKQDEEIIEIYEDAIYEDSW